MQQLKLLLQAANKYLNTADHLTYVTLPIVNDKKLFITIAENLYKANQAAVEAILHYDRLYKRIPPYPEEFENKLDFFKTRSAVRYNIPREYLVLIEDLKKIIDARKKAPMEFQRRDKYVICSKNYQMETLTIERLKNYLQQSKLFIQKTNQIIPIK